MNHFVTRIIIKQNVSEGVVANIPFEHVHQLNQGYVFSLNEPTFIGNNKTKY